METYILSSVWLGVNLKTDIKKACVQKDWTTSSKFVNHSRPNSDSIDINGGVGVYMIKSQEREP